jgi:Ca2+-binding RTX toxin-like protein
LLSGFATDTFGNTDTLTGVSSVTATNQADFLTGGLLDDSFAPGGGMDFIDGGAGFDQISYGINSFFNINTFGFGAVGITVNNTADNAGTVTDPTGAIDTFINVERVRGTGFVDTFYGGAFDDSFRGLGGADVFNGGAGFDEADYRSDANFGGTAGITANLGAGTIIDGFGATDTVNSIEQVVGTQFVDTITGDANQNTLRGDAGADFLYGGGGNDALRGGAGNDLIDGGAGYDKADFRDGTQGIVLTMTGGGAGTAVDAYGNTDTLVGIESVEGSSFADSMVGSSGDDDFRPGRGADTVNAGSGGFDQLNYLTDDAATSGVTVNLNTLTVTSTYFGNDTLVGVWDQVFGTQLSDTLIGSNTNTGNEWFNPSSGNDTINGGASVGGGLDVLSMNDYRTNATGTGVTFNITATGAGTVTGAAAGHTFTNIEVAHGTGNADFFNGGANATMVFRGLGGVDTYNGSVSGIEMVDYSRDAENGGVAGVSVNLGAGTGTDGFGNVETLTNIDNVTGTAQNDTMYGSVVANVMVGNLGNDLFVMGAGNDTGYGGSGNDFFYGGSGDDILLGEANLDVIVADDGNDYLYGGADFDYLFGGAGNDVLDGGDGVSVQYGEAGNDTLYGGIDTDHLYGGDGIDSLFGGAGNDIFYGSTGADSMFGGVGQDYFYASLGVAAASMFGGAGVDVFLGSTGADTLDGGADVDYFFGGAGNDTYIVGQNYSAEVIYDFTAGGTEDVISFVGSGLTSFADVQAHANYYGGINTTIITTVDGSSAVWLIGVDINAITAADFIFA